MSKKRMYFTSESVTEGHPDKVADYISDSILDACLAQDKTSRVACETLVKSNMVIIAGELTTKAVIDPEKIARQAIAQALADGGGNVSEAARLSGIELVSLQKIIKRMGR